MTATLCSRKAFLGGLFGSAVVAGCKSTRVGGFALPGARPDLRLGVLSDIHLCAEDGDFGKFGDAATFRHALEYFRAHDVDGVVVAGDLADNGMVSQLRKAADAWYAVFPDDRGRDGRRVEKLFVYGNHDLEGQGYDGYAKRFFDKASFARGQICTDAAKAWEEAFHEKYEPIWLKTVRGYQFVGAHWIKGRWEGIAGVEPWFREHAGEIDRSKPFFFIQHPHPKDTCFGADAWGHDAGFATRALSAFPNAVSFSGHSHDPATDDRFVWRGAFTAIGIGSLRYGSPDAAHSAVAGALAKKAKFVNELTYWNTRQGLLLDVYGNRLHLTCLDFARDERVRDDLVVEVPSASAVATSGSVYPAALRESATPPEWPAGAALAVERGADVWKVSFPSAHGASRVFGYELSFDLEGAAKLYALQPGFDLAERHVPQTVELAIPSSLLPKGAKSLSVVPVDSLGAHGKALVA